MDLFYRYRARRYGRITLLARWFEADAFDRHDPIAIELRRATALEF
jgi:hypothetical protein